MIIETRDIAARAQAPLRWSDGTTFFSLTCPVCGYPWALSFLSETRPLRTPEPHPDRCLFEVVCMGGQMDGDDILFPIRHVYPMHFDAQGCAVPLRLRFWDVDTVAQIRAAP